ncbi:MAG: hypothetical protein ACLFVO_24785 [Chloroflexaceae bacterium]
MVHFVFFFKKIHNVNFLEKDRGFATLTEAKSPAGLMTAQHLLQLPALRSGHSNQAVASMNGTIRLRQHGT